MPKWVEEVRCIEAGVGRVTPSPPAADGCAPLSVQVGAGDLDGFQADTEEEEEEEGDCVIMDISDVGDIQAPCGTTSGAGGSVAMDTSESLVASSSLGPS